MEHAHLFLDLMYAKMNMAPIIGGDKSQYLFLYDKTVRTPCTETVDDIKSNFGPKQAAYLENDKDSEL